MLSSLTGKPLGSLKSLRTGDVPVPATEEIESTYGPAYAAYSSYAAAQMNGVTIDEAQNTSPQGLKLVVRVEADSRWPSKL